MTLPSDKWVRDAICATRAALRQDRLVETGDRILVAVSGGPDSVALLRLLTALRSEFGIQLAVIHVDHGLRPQEARRDAAFVQHLADQLGLPLVYKDPKEFEEFLAGMEKTMEPTLKSVGLLKPLNK